MSSFMGSLASLSSRISADTTTATRPLCQNDPSTVGGRLRLCLLLFFLPSWPALLSTIVTTARLIPKVEQFIAIEEVRGVSHKMEYLGDLITSLQEERGVTIAFYVENATTRYEDLLETKNKTNKLTREDMAKDIEINEANIMQYLDNTRNSLSDTVAYNKSAVFDRYSDMINSLIRSLPSMTDTEVSNSFFINHYGIHELEREYELLLKVIYHCIDVKNLTEGEAVSVKEMIYNYIDSINNRQPEIELICSKNVPENVSDTIWNLVTDLLADQYGDLCAGNNTEDLNSLYMQALDYKTKVIKEMLDTSRKYDIKPAWNYQLILMIFFSVILLIQLPTIFFLLNNALITTECIRNIVSIFMSRTGELKAEKRKSELLLQEMLPRSIAKQLKLGRHVHAMQYESVTVYFSEVPDFVDISSKSEPLQIVNLLNNIYNFMDGKLELYDVYKVETIGSVYMVASGLPVKNEGKHVTEIAGLALDILEATDDFVIPHLPDRKLTLRIGAHTGPVVAGVVGNKAPRYCLFGDTVNTASRMQSTGEPSRVHISASTKIALDKMGGYITEHRGCIHVKGKGSMNTHWLKGKVLFRSRSKAQVTMMVQEKEGLLISDM